MFIAFLAGLADRAKETKEINSTFLSEFQPVCPQFPPFFTIFLPLSELILTLSR